MISHRSCHNMLLGRSVSLSISYMAQPVPRRLEMAEKKDSKNKTFSISEQGAEFSTAEAPENTSVGVDNADFRKKSIVRDAGRSVDRLFIDENGDEVANYTGDEQTERDYMPVRQSHEYKSGCLGGIMYFAFVLCISVVLACLAWMAVSDALALNKSGFSAEVTLPSSIFDSETVDTFDEDGNKTGTKRVTHADIDYVANELKEAGLIEYKWLFEAFCKLSTADEKVSPGTYELQSSFDYRALIKNMRPGSGAALTIKVTIPEGFTMRQIFERLEENEVCSYDDLMESATNSSFNYDFLAGTEPGDPGRLEGFLYPDTYEFYVGMQASSAINKLLETFYYKQTADMLKMADYRGITMHDVVILASLIEKEAANDEERPIISSVIYNRINAGMSIGLESAILYVYPEHEGAPTAEMMEEDSPYNLNKNLGLPPTAICSPGMPSINAALNPSNTQYYYFMLDNETGTHKFFTNYNDFYNFVRSQSNG